jgi:hypothetical protein
LNDRHTDHEIAAAERLIAGLINNPTLAPVVAMIGLTVEHFPPGMGLRNSFRFAMAGRDCVAALVASKHEDLSRQVLRRLAGLRVELTVAEAKALAQHLLEPLAVRIAADRRPRPRQSASCAMCCAPVPSKRQRFSAKPERSESPTRHYAGPARTSASGSRRQGSGTAGRGRSPKVATDFPKMATNTGRCPQLELATFAPRAPFGQYYARARKCIGVAVWPAVVIGAIRAHAAVQNRIMG